MRGDAPKGQGGVCITTRNIYSPRPRFRFGHPLINEGDKIKTSRPMGGWFCFVKALF